MGDLEHLVSFERGHDCMRFECVNGSDRCFPGGGGSHGVGGLKIRFVAKGDKGAVQFLLFTGLTPQAAWPSKWATSDFLPADLGYHSKTPHYEGQETIQDACEYCDGQPCYYDGSGVNADDAMLALVNGGHKGLWEFLDAYYLCEFEGAKYPQPCEYPFALRVAQSAA